MEINWLIIGIIVVCAVALIIYIIKQNRKDQKSLEEKLNKREFD